MEKMFKFLKCKSFFSKMAKVKILEISHFNFRRYLYHEANIYWMPYTLYHTKSSMGSKNEWFLSFVGDTNERINELFAKWEVHFFLKSYVLSYSHKPFNIWDNGDQIDPSAHYISDMIIDAFNELK